jgi:hypothetical protein
MAPRDSYHVDALEHLKVARSELTKAHHNLGNDCPAYDALARMVEETFDVERRLEHP